MGFHALTPLEFGHPQTQRVFFHTACVSAKGVHYYILVAVLKVGNIYTMRCMCLHKS
jgi:hypothetical protein